MFSGTFIPTDALIQEANDYAHRAAPFTSNRHDFHEGGLEAKERKMAEGKYGEKAFKIIEFPDCFTRDDMLQVNHVSPLSVIAYFSFLKTRIY